MEKRKEARVRQVVEAPNTMSELRNELLKLYADIRNGDVDLNEAAECNNTAGKIINSVKVQGEIMGLLKKAPETKFITESK